MRRSMELGMVRAGEWRAGALGGSAGVAGDILEGRDWSCEWDDVFTGRTEYGTSLNRASLILAKVTKIRRLSISILKWKIG